MTVTTFEQTYTNYPFAPLVTLVLKLGVWLGHKDQNDDVELPTGMAHSA